MLKHADSPGAVSTSIEGQHNMNSITKAASSGGSFVPNCDLVIPELSGSKIRRTENGRFSVYDLIRIAGGKKNPHDTWKRMTGTHSELLAKCESEELGAGKPRNQPQSLPSRTVYTSLGCCLESAVKLTERQQLTSFVAIWKAMQI